MTRPGIIRAGTCFQTHHIIPCIDSSERQRRRRRRRRWEPREGKGTYERKDPFPQALRPSQPCLPVSGELGAQSVAPLALSPSAFPAFASAIFCSYRHCIRRTLPHHCTPSYPLCFWHLPTPLCLVAGSESWETKRERERQRPQAHRFIFHSPVAWLANRFLCFFPRSVSYLVQTQSTSKTVMRRRQKTIPT